MKAIIFNEYGGPEVLKLTELSDPIPGPGEVRIRIHAAGVNPIDCKIRKGLVQKRIQHILPIIPGWDGSGTIDTMGEGATLFNLGDSVYAYCRKPVVQFGTYAQYIVLSVSQVALKPATMNFEQAASIPLSSLTAWQSLFEAASLTAGQTALIHAGAGGVGGFAIQMAKQAGAYVISTSSKKNLHTIRELGADEAIDYTKKDFCDAVMDGHPQGVDVVFDTVGADVQLRSIDAVRKGGTLVSILAYSDEAKEKAKDINLKYVFVEPNREQLIKLAELIDAGKMLTRIAALVPLEEAQHAHEMIESGHTAGKIVLVIP